jgi:hypothetical protein
VEVESNQKKVGDISLQDQLFKAPDILRSHPGNITLRRPYPNSVLLPVLQIPTAFLRTSNPLNLHVRRSKTPT